jgi:predicted glycoside hydrolase/deacetylase ChbG (UPF0249 family)
MDRALIVNADDFGQSAGTSRCIIRCFEQGIVTSASLMVRWPAAQEAADEARTRGLDLGLHFDLGEWRLRAGEWIAVYGVAPLDDTEAVAAELQAQLAAFRAMTGTDPSHIDSHQHVHLKPGVRPVVESLAARLKIPVRHLDTRVRYCGDFYGQDENGSPLPDRISVESIIRIILELPAGMNELCCHPGEPDDLDTMYRDERLRESEVLRDPAVRQAIADAGIRLCSFSEIAGAACG